MSNKNTKSDQTMSEQTMSDNKMSGNTKNPKVLIDSESDSDDSVNDTIVSNTTSNSSTSEKSGEDKGKETETFSGEKQHCKGCTLHRPIEYFVGKNGKPVKTCLKCREKDAKYSLKPERILSKNIRQKEKQYYKAHREKKKAEDLEGYLKHNAEVHKIWYQKNQQRVRQWTKTNINTYILSMMGQAKKKGIPWNLSYEKAEEIMRKSCVYCGFSHNDPKRFNGIDRMNNNDSYRESNVVSCCKHCNFFKKSLDPITFIQRCAQISKKHGGVGDLCNDIWSNSFCVSYDRYKTRADSKKYVFEITKDQYNMLISGDCYYCGRKNTANHYNGIDRKDNSVGYKIENCVPCCSECNLSKAAMSDEEFIQHCKKVAQFNIGNTFKQYSHIPRCYKCISKRIMDQGSSSAPIEPEIDDIDTEDGSEVFGDIVAE